MSDVEIEASSDDGIRQFILKLQNAQSRGFRDVLETWGEEVALPWIAAHWPRPDWPPLEESTIRAKERAHFPGVRSGDGFPLIESGRLFAAATERGAPGNIFEVDEESLTIGVSGEAIPYASTQHDGSSKIPARPWDDLSGPPVEDLTQRILSALDGNGRF